MNLLKEINTICGRCQTQNGECPDCGTFWRNGTGFRIQWAPDGRDLFLKTVSELSSKLNLPPGTIQVYEVKP